MTGMTKLMVSDMYSLPQKSGFPQDKINEIHGAWFDPSNPVVQFSGKLRSDLFDWLCDMELATDLCLCLGTSLSGMNADRAAVTCAKRSIAHPPTVRSKRKLELTLRHWAPLL